MLRTINPFTIPFRRTFLNLRTFRPASTMAANDQLKNSKLFDVSKLTAVVTGGGTGIGLVSKDQLYLPDRLLTICR